MNQQFRTQITKKNSMNKLKALLKKFLLSQKSSHPYPNKGGWPGLSALPNVDTLIDVGIGHQGTEGLYSYFPNTFKFFIDPIEETKKAVASHLENRNNQFFVCALSDHTGSLDLIVRDPISQSGFDLRDDESSKILTRKVPVETLDNLFSSVSISGTYGIKIDVEGYELKVIHGGNTLISQSSWLVVETSISNSRFQNSSSFKDVFLLLTSMGFELVSIRVSKDYLDHCDLAFINRARSK